MDIIENAKQLAEQINTRSADIEQARRLPADIAQSIAEAGLFRMLIPASLGGLQCHPGTVIEAIEAISRANASAGWCTMIAATTGVSAAYLQPAIAAAIFSPPALITGGVFAPMGKAIVDGDGYRLSGHWNWASGSANCDWLLGGAMVMENDQLKRNADGSPLALQFLFPAEQATLQDTWHVTGLVGTGSGDMLVDNLYVPATHSLSLAADKPVASGPLYAFPVFGLLAMGIAAVSLGNARAAIDDLKELARGKKSQGSSKTLADRATSQSQLAQAEATLGSARAFLFDAVHKAYAAAENNGSIALDIRANVRLAATYAVRQCADVTRSMYDLGGGSAVFLSSPLQRRMRDAHVATQHMMVAPQSYELVGRVGFGLDTDSTFL